MSHIPNDYILDLLTELICLERDLLEEHQHPTFETVENLRRASSLMNIVMAAVSVKWNLSIDTSSPGRVNMYSRKIQRSKFFPFLRSELN